MAVQRRVFPVVLVVLSLLFLLPAAGQAEECPKCYDDCSWLLGKALCAELPQGLVGYCHCKERPCVVSGTFCTVIIVTP
ncbi:MAG TPA: hypothetical protein VHU81_14360 [Thermoanaerobaculia bacterium]|jgi:hypothetical protein|nr:hypothetical protein [Thermoanaerobaculia bacterium]